VQDEPREPGAQEPEEPNGTERDDGSEKKSHVISIIQQNAVIINGRSMSPQGRDGKWI